MESLATLDGPMSYYILKIEEFERAFKLNNVADIDNISFDIVL